MKQEQQNFIGKVIYFNNEEGYGTIKYQNGEIVFLYNQLPIEGGEFKVPQINQQVSFEIEKKYFSEYAVNLKFME